VNQEYDIKIIQLTLQSVPSTEKDRLHTVMIRDYHTTVFISTRISSPNVDNCPKHRQKQLSTGGLI